MIEERKRRATVPDVDRMSVEEQRDFYKSTSEELMGLVLWTLQNFGAMSPAALVFVTDRDDERHGQVIRWQDRFFDKLDALGYAVDRTKYYADVAAKILPEEEEGN